MSEKSNSLNKINLVYHTQNSINNQEIKEISKDLYKISKKNNSNKIINYNNIHNLDMVAYDYILLNRQILNSTIQYFNFFNGLVEDIEKKFRPAFLYSSDIKEIKVQGKFSFNRYNITNLISLNENNTKNIELSINNKYIHCRNI